MLITSYYYQTKWFALLTVEPKWVPVLITLNNSILNHLFDDRTWVDKTFISLFVFSTINNGKTSENFKIRKKLHSLYST